MPITPPPQPLESALAELQELYELLATERTALISRDIKVLETTVARKQVLCDAIDGSIDTASFASPDLEHSLQDSLQEEVVNLVKACGEQNAINGKILQRSRNSVATLLQLLTGNDSNVYSRQGKTLEGFTDSHRSLKA